MSNAWIHRWSGSGGGDEEAIDHFGVSYLCGGFRGAQLRAEPTDRRISVHWVEPRCEELCEFQVAGYQMGGLMLTPRSNTVIWDGGECERGRTVTVSFDYFRPIPAVEGRGPIYGDLWANEEVLSFDGAEEAYCGFYEKECGYYIHEQLTVADLFHDIRIMKELCGDCSYEAPSYSAVQVPVPEGEDLTIGFDVWQYHLRGEDALICRDQVTFEYDELRDTDYYVFPSYDFVEPCRLQISTSVWEWIAR